MRFRNEFAAALALGSAACGQLQQDSRPIQERATAVQVEYGRALASHFYATGHEVQCEMQAQNDGHDPTQACADQASRVSAAESVVENFRARYPDEARYLDMHCRQQAMTSPDLSWPVFMLDCNSKIDNEGGETL